MTKEEIREMAAWAWEEMERVKSALEKENEYGLVPIVDMDNGYILASYGEGLKMLGLDDDGEDDGRCYLATEGGGVIAPVFDADDLAEELEKRLAEY